MRIRQQCGPITHVFRYSDVASGLTHNRTQFFLLSKRELNQCLHNDVRLPACQTTNQLLVCSRSPCLVRGTRNEEQVALRELHEND